MKDLAGQTYFRLHPLTNKGRLLGLRGFPPRSTAFISGPEGVNPIEAFGAPSGYQPSVKYCLIRARDPATRGVAMLVPLSTAMKQDGLLACLHNKIPVLAQSKPFCTSVCTFASPVSLYKSGCIRLLPSCACPSLTVARKQLMNLWDLV